MKPGRHLKIALLMVAVLTCIGTAGYRHLVGLSWVDSLYMTVITLSTVGYTEVGDLGPTGRLFTVMLIISGVGAVFYSIAALAEFVIEGRLRQIWERRTMTKLIEQVHDHVIVCGFGRLGRAVATQLHQDGVPVVVLDSNPELEEELTRLGLPHLIGSALEEGILDEAGVKRAAAMVTALSSDADNLYITLSAREAKPELKIHVRAETESGARRLRLAGADQVILPHALGGQRIAQAIRRPAVVDFIELVSPGSGVDINIEEIILCPESPLHEKSLRELRDFGVRVSVVAIQREDTPLQLNPKAEATLVAGDRIVVVGDLEALERLAKLAAAEPVSDPPAVAS